MTSDLIRVKGIGEKAASLLVEAGINSVEQLANTTVENLTKIKGIGIASANKWIEGAKELINGHNLTSNPEIDKVSISAPKIPPKKAPKSAPKISPKKAPKSAPKAKSQTAPKISPKKAPKSAPKSIPTPSSSTTQIASISTPTPPIPKAITTQNNSQSVPIIEKSLDFTDTSAPIPAFLLNRMSKKAIKILHISYNSMNREPLKNLETYVKILNPERIKFDPSFPDEKNASLAIDEKLKFIETLIRKSKDNESQSYLHNSIIIPMENGEFKAITERLGAHFGPEEAAIKIFDSLNKKVKKILLKNATEIANIRDILKIIENSYPEKVKLFYDNRKR